MGANAARHDDETPSSSCVFCYLRKVSMTMSEASSPVCLKTQSLNPGVIYSDRADDSESLGDSRVGDLHVTLSDLHSIVHPNCRCRITLCWLTPMSRRRRHALSTAPFRHSRLFRRYHPASHFAFSHFQVSIPGWLNHLPGAMKGLRTR